MGIYSRQKRERNKREREIRKRGERPIRSITEAFGDPRLKRLHDIAQQLSVEFNADVVYDEQRQGLIGPSEKMEAIGKRFWMIVTNGASEVEPTS